MITVLKGGLSEVRGFSFIGVRAGIKRKGLDLALIKSDIGPVPAAGVFTSNLVKAAPVLLTMKNLKGGKLGAVFINSGRANCLTGIRGQRDAEEIAKTVAKLLRIEPTHVGVLSTGLIGAPLPMVKVKRGILKAVSNLRRDREASLKVSQAMMTTDTFPKEVAVATRLEDGTEVRIAGVAKGSGMIRPKLATMLAVILTDAKATPGGLRLALRNSVEKSFNMITVDNDTSTNDSVLILASGLAGGKEISARNVDSNFQEALDFVTTELAKMIVRDGEGAKHFFEVKVERARNFYEAKFAALAVAGSNLVKAAIFGEDPNWGRVVAALGASGANFNPSNLSVWFESEKEKVCVIRKGIPLKNAERARNVMREKEFRIRIDLAEGEASATAWGCDLTFDYVKINARYRT
jgi:glutamate N-acetyltransferase/amino-acid N-acetyltransferase